jgi:hypothetical protein
MDWADGPATWKQLRYLSHFGYKPDHALTKSEANELICRFGGHPEVAVAVTESPHQEHTQPITAYDLRLTAQAAAKTLAAAGPHPTEKCQGDAARAHAVRQEFWVDTCRDPAKTLLASRQAHTFYQKFGCRFFAPTPKQVQSILEALDSAIPAWDRDNPEMFYRTLELNFPELLRHH